MNKRQRKHLCELMDYCNMLGGILDGTSTNAQKYIDRQRALMDAYKVVYAVLTDDKENDHMEEDYESAGEALNRMKELTTKNYPDRNGKTNI